MAATSDVFVDATRWSPKVGWGRVSNDEGFREQHVHVDTREQFVVEIGSDTLEIDDPALMHPQQLPNPPYTIPDESLACIGGMQVNPWGSLGPRPGTPTLASEEDIWQDILDHPFRDDNFTPQLDFLEAAVPPSVADLRNVSFDDDVYKHVDNRTGHVVYSTSTAVAGCRVKAYSEIEAFTAETLFIHGLQEGTEIQPY